MNTTVRNISGSVLGAIVGGVVNIEIVMQSRNIIPPPPGADLTTDAGLKAAMHLMQPQHFIMPFLAHALGTLAGAYLAALIVASHKMRFALGIGVLFLIGGAVEVFSLPSPLWFSTLDLLVAYIPMAYLGAKLADKT